MQQIDGPDVWRRLPMAAAIDALELAVRTSGVPPVPPRMHLGDGGQQLLVMPAMADGWAGVKLITIDPENPGRGRSLVNGAYVLFEPPGLEPAAVVEGRALTELRTAAVSGLATRHLARPDAAHLVIFGAGAQGRSHLIAMAAVRELAEVRIVAPRSESIDAFLAFAAAHVTVPVLAGNPGDVAGADLVCVCTSSSTPVFDGHLLPAGAHVNAIGSYRPDMQEVDTATVVASRVVVETREAALAEKGDLLQAEEAGLWSRDAIVADLAELVRARSPVRTRAEDRTLFASVGVAFEDLVVARAVVRGGGRPPQADGTSPR